MPQISILNVIEKDVSNSSRLRENEKDIHIPANYNELGCNRGVGLYVDGPKSFSVSAFRDSCTGIVFYGLAVH